MLQLTIEQAFATAVRQHQAGRLAEAQQLYRQILSQQPRHAEALHLLGVIALQVGRYDAAIDLIRQAIALKPDSPEAHSNLGNALKEKGQLDEAIGAYQKAIRLNPNYADAYNNLSVALTQGGRFDEALAAARQAIALKSGFAEAHNNLGNVLKNKAQVDEAIEAYQNAIALQPQYAEAYSNLGLALQDKGRLDEAAAAFRRAMVLKPSDAGARFNLGNVLKAQGHLDEAIEAYRGAIAQKPDFAEAYSNLGSALHDQRRFDEAIAAYRQAIALQPDYADAHNNLSTALKETGQLDEAVAACRRAIALKPDFAEACSNLGNALTGQGKCEEAIAAYRRAITLKANYPEAYYNLAIALKDSGRVDEAAEACRQAIAINANYPEAYSNLGVVLTDKGQLDEAIAAFRQAVALRPGYSSAQSNLVFTLNYHPGYPAEAIRKELARWNLQHASPLQAFIEGHPNDRSPERRLRIGYVSPDFREHPVGRFLLPLLANHDKSQVEVFAYAQVAVPDAFTAVLRSRTERWRSTVGLSDAQVAGLVRQDRIDILVDLALHTSGNRLLVFARKPAPVQVTFAGYPGSTGLQTIDYRLTDPYLDPPGLPAPSEQWYSEESYRLAESFWCFDAQTPPSQEPPVGPLLAISKGFVTFGCLNNFCKVNDSVLELWAKVLLAVKGSRLILLAKEGSHRQRTIDFLERQGVAGERVEFRSPRPRKEYLAMYDELDIGLDTLPYNGHTTSLDSFWMGVPVITLVGRTVVGRAGLSQLTNLGLGELAASTAEDFVAIAAKLAGDVAGLGSLRGGLRERMKASPLTDAPRFARGLEAAYRTMWRKWCAAAATEAYTFQ